MPQLPCPLSVLARLVEVWWQWPSALIALARVEEHAVVLSQWLGKLLDDREGDGAD